MNLLSVICEESTLNTLSYKSLWLMALMAGGTVFQTTSCSTILAETLSGLAISVVNEYIRQVVSQLLGISTGVTF